MRAPSYEILRMFACPYYFDIPIHARTLLTCESKKRLTKQNIAVKIFIGAVKNASSACPCCDDVLLKDSL
jgi:hypothetical protein